VSDNKNMENQEPVIITFNDVEYRKSDLTEEQMALASRLNLIGRKLASDARKRTYELITWEVFKVTS